LGPVQILVILPPSFLLLNSVRSDGVASLIRPSVCDPCVCAYFQVSLICLPTLPSVPDVQPMFAVYVTGRPEWVCLCLSQVILMYSPFLFISHIDLSVWAGGPKLVHCSPAELEVDFMFVCECHKWVCQSFLFVLAAVLFLSLSPVPALSLSLSLYLPICFSFCIGEEKHFFLVMRRAISRHFHWSGMDQSRC
jgi:hypothetical protein